MEFEKIQMIIADVLSFNPEEIREDMSFVDDLGADSLEVFQIIMAVEEEFDIQVQEEVARKVETVEDLIRMVSV